MDNIDTFDDQFTKILNSDEGISTEEINVLFKSKTIKEAIVEYKIK